MWSPHPSSLALVAALFLSLTGAATAESITGSPPSLNFAPPRVSTPPPDVTFKPPATRAPRTVVRMRCRVTYETDIWGDIRSRRHCR